MLAEQRVLSFSGFVMAVAGAELPVHKAQRSMTHGRSRANSVVQPPLSARLQDWPPPLLSAIHPPVALQHSDHPLGFAHEQVRHIKGEGQGEGMIHGGYTARKTLVVGFFVVIFTLPCILLANPVIYYLCVA